MLDPTPLPALLRPPPPPGSGTNGRPLRLPPAIALLLLAMGLVMLLRQLATPDLDYWLLSAFGLSFFLDGAFRPERLATLVSSLFLHSGWLHFFFNALWIAIFASLLQPALGGLRLLLLFLATAVVGGLLYELANWRHEGVAIGASAAAFGLLGAYAHLTVAHPLASRGMKLRKLGVFALLMLAVNYAYGQLDNLPGAGGAAVAWEAHAGGFLAGLALFPLLRITGRRSVTANPRV